MPDYKQNWGVITRRAKRRGMTITEYIEWLRGEHDGNMSAAARELGVTRAAMYFHLQQAKQAAREMNE